MSIAKSLRLSVLATALAAGLAVGTIALLAQVFFPKLPDWQIVSFAALFGGLCAAVAAYFATTFLDSQFGAVDAVLERERQSEHALRRSHAELESRLAERVAELSALNRELEIFASAIAHDLRSPLRSMHAFASILDQDFSAALDSEGRKFVAIIRDESVRMENLIEGLLEFARVNRAPLEKTTIDVSALTAEVVQEMRGGHTGRQVEVDIHDGMAVVADRYLLRIVLEKLIDNALKFSAAQPSARITVGQEQVAGETVYFVADDGAGFDMQQSARLFGPFQRLHDAAQFAGTGSGLFIARSIVNRHGGRIWGDAVVKHGATFRFTIAPWQEVGRARNL
jgi:light-regulated signal transduction histidine kinase (bacteriophytochrome)